MIWNNFLILVMGDSLNNKLKGKLGFGLMRLPLTDENDSSSIDENQLKDMVDKFMDSGFNYFDTGYSYHKGLSEVYFKKLIVDRYNREDYILVDKMPSWLIKSKDDLPKYFNEQIDRCGVDYFDYYLMHCVGQDTHDVLMEAGSYDFLINLKKEGKIKHIGISLHDNAEYLDNLLQNIPEIEMVLLQINYVDWEDSNIESRKCYEVAKKHGKEIMVMEPVKGGALVNVPKNIEDLFKEYNSANSIASWALRFCGSLDAVSVVVSGMSNMEQLEDNIKTMSNFECLNDEEYEIINEAIDIIDESIAIHCTSCNYCLDACPENIPISKFLSLFNNQYKFGFQPLYLEYYNNLSSIYGAKASSCISCDMCKKHCPQKIDIPLELEKCVDKFENRS